MLEEILISPKISGTEVAYYIVCKRKLWLFSHNISFERDSDLVLIGKVISEESFKKEKFKELMIEESLKIDFIQFGDEIIVHEVKKSKKLEEAHIWQVKFYIYNLKELGLNCNRGVIHYPKIFKKVDVNFQPEDVNLIEEALAKIHEIIKQEKAPDAIRKPYCKKCAYHNFCFI